MHENFLSWLNIEEEEKKQGKFLFPNVLQK